VYHQQFENTLSTFAFPTIGKPPVSVIETGHVVKLLRPIWVEKHVTAARVRGRVEAILDWARAHGYRTGENPAAWKGNLDAILPSTKKIATAGVEHHQVMPFAEVPALMERLRASDNRMATVVELLVLTATRVSEALGMHWEEVNL
jgi:integrase